jgi:hypothetical protein
MHGQVQVGGSTALPVFSQPVLDGVSHIYVVASKWTCMYAEEKEHQRRSLSKRTLHTWQEYYH